MREFLRRNHFLAVFTPLSSMMGFGLGMSQVVTSLTALHLGATPFQIAWIAAAQNLGTLLTSVQAGILIDQFGPVVPYMIGSGLIAVAYFAIPLSNSPWWLLGGTIAVSLLMPFRFVSMTSTFLAQLHSMGEAKAGWQRGSHMIGMFLLGPALGALFISIWGFRATWWIIAALAFATTVAGPFVFLRHPARRGAGPRLSLSGIWSQMSLLWKEPVLRQCAAVDFLTQATSAFFTFFIVVIAVRSLGISPLQATHFVNAKGASFILALFFLGGFASRLGAQASIKASFSVLVVALFILSRGKSMPVLIPASLLLGLGLGLVQITNLTRQARVGVRVGLGRVAGVTPLVATSGSLTGNQAGGLLGSEIGLQNVFLVLGGACALYLAFSLHPSFSLPEEPSREFSLGIPAESIGLD